MTTHKQVVIPSQDPDLFTNSERMLQHYQIFGRLDCGCVIAYVQASNHIECDMITCRKIVTVVDGDLVGTQRGKVSEKRSYQQTKGKERVKK